MNGTILDTSILYEIFLEGSEVHQEFLERSEGEQWYVNIHIIDELFILLRARKKDVLAFQVLEPLLQGEISEVLPVLPQHIEGALHILKKYRDKRLSFTDAIILAQAKDHHCEIWTHDEEMKKSL